MSCVSAAGALDADALAEGVSGVQPLKAIPAKPAVAALFRKLRREVFPSGRRGVFLSIAALTISYILTLVKQSANVNFKVEEIVKINSVDILHTIQQNNRYRSP